MMMFLVFCAYALVCWTYALRFGGSEARQAFLLFVMAFAGTYIIRKFFDGFSIDPGSDTLNIPLLITDTAYLVGFGRLALQSRHYWVVWSAGLLLARVLAHLGPALDPSIDLKIYRHLEGIWIYPMLLTMVVGIAKDRSALELRRASGLERGSQRPIPLP